MVDFEVAGKGAGLIVKPLWIVQLCEGTGGEGVLTSIGTLKLQLSESFEGSQEHSKWQKRALNV